MILVIEDSPLGSIYCKQLNLGGYPAERAETGCDGVTKAAELRPDLMLVDFYLPDINGAEVVQRVRADGYAGPAVVMSGDLASVSADDLARFDSQLPKPIRLNRLMEEVGRWVQRETPLPPDVQPVSAK